MVPRAARALLPTLVWGCSAASSLAAGDEPSVWTQTLATAPGIWAILTVAALGAAALVAHLAYSLSQRRGSPAALTGRLTQAMDAGNYQEAWEICGQWPSAYLSRVLRPAMERIGHGRDGVIETLDRHLQRERRAVTILNAALLGLGVVIPLLGVLRGWLGWNALRHTDWAVPTTRALTVAEGDFVLLAAVGIGVSVASGVFWFGFRSRARTIFAAVGERAPAFVSDLPYEDLEGLHIGREFDAGTLLGGDEARQTTGALRVSRELTSSCPQCNAPINFTQKACQNCGSALEWN